jgi:hypothetical protein
MGTDLAAIDLARFLRDQRISATSTAFIFTKTGEVIALPDAARIAKAVQSDGQMLVVPPKIGYLNDPVIADLVAAYALPLYVTLVIAWIDRLLEGRGRWPGSGDED